MLDREVRFQPPPRPQTTAGAERRVGFEIEFAGLSLAQAGEVIAKALGAELRQATAAESRVTIDDIGTFQVEIDWALLKNAAREQSQSPADAEASTSGGYAEEMLSQIGKLATTLVPVELVCPPIAIGDLACLNKVTDALRCAGATGTGSSLTAAYGVHINTELPTVDADTLGSYLRAFCLLQWWLFDAHSVDITRRLTPYVDLYPRAYLNTLLAHDELSMDSIFDDYLTHNATRNRALDLLPLLAHIDTDRVRQAVDDPRIKARPAFHYRLPNCHIEDPDWSLQRPWDLWCVVEKLACDAQALAQLSSRFLDARRMFLDVDRRQWVEDIDAWLRDREWA